MRQFTTRDVVIHNVHNSLVEFRDLNTSQVEDRQTMSQTITQDRIIDKGMPACILATQDRNPSGEATMD